MEKQRKKWRIKEYLWELSIVIIGVTVTFGGSGYLKNREQKIMLKKNMIAVKNELEYNMYDIDVKLTFYEDESKLKNYFQTISSPAEASKDTIQKYLDGVFTSFNYYYKKDAFELLKGSESINQLNDIHLLLNIMDAYRILQFGKESNDISMMKKKEIVLNSLKKANLDKTDINSLTDFLCSEKGIDIFLFIKFESGNAESALRITKGTIEEVLLQIDKALN